MQPKYMTIDQWVQFSGLGRTTTYGLMTTGDLRAIKAGRRTLIDVDAGLAWLASRPAAVCGDKVAVR